MYTNEVSYIFVMHLESRCIARVANRTDEAGGVGTMRHGKERLRALVMAFVLLLSNLALAVRFDQTDCRRFPATA